MTRRCSHCSLNGHNSRTCPNRGVKIFGVRLTDGLIRKSASMGNLTHYTGPNNATLRNGHESPGDTPDHGGAAADGYASEDFVAGSSSSRERKKGVPWTEEEHRMFLLGLHKLGKGDWRGIARNYVISRTPTQVASHAQKYFIRQSNMSRRKRRSSLFDIVADEKKTQGQMQKKTQGRKKIDIKKIDELSRRQVTFSKRRTGLFNKVSELCVLTGAEAAILVESPGGRVFAFGSPSVESVMGRYLGGSSTGAPDPQQPGSEPDRAMLEQYNQQYSEISKELEAEKNKNAAMEEKKEENHWWEESIEELGLEELEKYIAAMEKLRDNMNTKAKELAMIRKSSTFDPSQNPSNNNNDHDVFPVDDYNYLANEPEDDLGYNFTFDDEQIRSLSNDLN